MKTVEEWRDMNLSTGTEDQPGCSVLNRLESVEQLTRQTGKCRQLRSIRRSVPTSVYHTLVVALVLSRLDYGNVVLVGLPAYLYNRLQSVLNAAAPLRDPSPVYEAPTTSPTHLPVSTG